MADKSWIAIVPCRYQRINREHYFLKDNYMKKKEDRLKIREI